MKLYHVTDRDNVKSILTTGIRPSVGSCPIPPEREKAVFATDRDTQKRTGVYRSEDDVPYAIIEFEVDGELLDKGVVGDIYEECKPEYLSTMMPLKEFATDYPMSLRKYREVEVYFPGIGIKPSRITNVYYSEDQIP